MKTMYQQNGRFHPPHHVAYFVQPSIKFQVGLQFLLHLFLLPPLKIPFFAFYRIQLSE
jgi:hypothetical protein